MHNNSVQWIEHIASMDFYRSMRAVSIHCNTVLVL